MKIGITQRTLVHKGFSYDSLEPSWYTLFDKHEIIPIPNTVNIKQELYEDIDLLIVSGGDDNATRRIVETRLITFMLANRRPIIGVCHGAFLLTHLFDGLVESIDKVKQDHFVYSSNDQVLVNSYHNLAITNPPKDTTVLYTDGTYAESWVHDYLKIGTIVWHPERMTDPFIPQELLEFITE
jgi:gamma-glutamyl-gamma-aminobutyrate hydrolase PuuD